MKDRGLIPSMIDRIIYSIFAPPAPFARCQACSWFRYSKREILTAPLPPGLSRAAINIEEIRAANQCYKNHLSNLVYKPLFKKFLKDKNLTKAGKMPKGERCDNMCCIMNETDERGKTDCKRTKYPRTVAVCPCKMAYDNLMSERRDG